MTWTFDLVTLQLEAAARTLRALPGRAAPAGFAPFATEFSPAEEARPRRALPLPAGEAITAADRAFTWLALVPDASIRRLVCRRALRIPWRRLAAETGCSHETCRTRHRKGIELIVAALNRAAAPMSRRLAA